MFVHRIWRRFSTPALHAALLAFGLLAAAPHGQAQERPRALVKNAPPVYPELAKQMRVEGSIRLLISILPDGHVSAMHVASGHPMLVPAAEAAVREWRYAAAAATTEAVVSIDFHLH